MSDEGMMNAARVMREAAETMKRAAGNMDDAFLQHQRFLDDWLNQLRTLVEEAKS